jgi:hypothetical protein
LEKCLGNAVELPNLGGVGNVFPKSIIPGRHDWKKVVITEQRLEIAKLVYSIIEGSRTQSGIILDLMVLARQYTVTCLLQ